jgi:GH25 family lysozyme M1 (1,4-beta-N-acetylmuramidase)
MILKMCDVSSHQGGVDFEVMKTRDVSGVAIRATVGGLYTDPMFFLNWERAGAAGLPRTAYHVTKPGQPIASQVRRFKDVVGDRRPDFKVVGWVNDCELFDRETASEITKITWGVTNELAAHAGVEPFIYTRMSYWNQATNPAVTWARFPLWVARYTLASAPWFLSEPAYLRPRKGEWLTWDAWQWSADGNNQGKKHGCLSPHVDLNRVRSWVFDGIGVPDPPDPPDPEPYVINLPLVVAGKYKKID